MIILIINERLTMVFCRKGKGHSMARMARASSCDGRSSVQAACQLAAYAHTRARSDAR